MILEVAEIDIKAGSMSAFEPALREAVELLHQAHGFQGCEILRSVEVPDRYRLLVRWDSVESHITGFQKSPLFQQWRQLLGGYFARTPSVEHMQYLSSPVGAAR
jgi:heme-degrading monooxygenase HmoA